MRNVTMNSIYTFIFTALLVLALSSAVFAQATGSVSGQVMDTLNAVIPGATVTVVDSTGKQKQSITNDRGEFTVSGLAPGTYTVKAIAPKFGLYENSDVEVTAGQKTELIIPLTVAAIDESVDVSGSNTVSDDANSNANATVLKGQDLDALPDDPDELAAALQALAGTAAGPDGGQISIDGFSNGTMPPKEAIREIRINQNPFSAEYDRIGFGRIEILTRPGYDKFRGSANFNFNDESLNSRNPFALNRAPSQMRNYGGFFSGPIKAKRSSFFVDVSENERDENSVVSAIVLDSAANIVSFNKDVTVPTRRFSISPRIDFAINDSNSVTVRYNFNRSSSKNQGIGGFTLPSRASRSSGISHGLQFTESAIINPRTVNETRFSFDYNKSDQFGDDTMPTVSVANAFVGGGAQVGNSFTKTKRWELNNATTTSFGKDGQHAVKFGIRLRGVSIDSRSESNYTGTFVFSGFLDDNGTPADPTDDFFVSSINQYRQKVLGNPDPRYNPNQFTLTTGNPLASVSQFDYSPYITDDWKARPDLTLSFGLRYENQSNISDNLNFAPRFGFAWAPGAGGAKAPKTVFRGGFGVFYTRFSEGNTLRAIRQDGVSQLQYIVTSNPAILGQAIFHPDGTVTNVPTSAQLGAVTPLASTPFRIEGDIRTPYSLQSALSVERQINAKTVLSATFTQTNTYRGLLTRNTNAPVCPDLSVCPTGLTTAQIQALRPDPTLGNIYEMESSAKTNAQFVNINLRSTIRSKYTISGGYTLSWAKGYVDSMSSPRFSAGTVGYPMYSYDMSSEYGPSAFNSRHSLFLVGSAQLPWGIRANTMVIASTGRPFNITSGVDSNYDSLFFDRPTYSALHDRCQQLGLTASWCDISDISSPDTTIIPRNYGRGPGSFTMNLNLSKTFGFGGSSDGGGGMGGGMGGPGGRMGGGRGGMFGGGDTRSRYNLTIGVNIQNLLNTVNLGTPVGALTSPSFGRSRSTGGGFGFFGGGGGSANRRIDLSVRFNW